MVFGSHFGGTLGLCHCVIGLCYADDEYKRQQRIYCIADKCKNEVFKEEALSINKKIKKLVLFEFFFLTQKQKTKGEEGKGFMLAAFAKHTRQSEEDAANISKLAQKYIAVHVTLAPTPLVYNCIASDYKLLELRTHNPPLQHYQQESMDVPTFVHITKNGFQNLHESIEHENKWQFYSFFKETVFPKPVGEEAWKSYHKPDLWKERAYFLALNCNNKAQFGTLIRAIHAENNDNVDKDMANQLISKLSQFTRDNTHILVNIDPTEIGEMIAQIQLKEEAAEQVQEIGCNSCGGCKKKEEDEEEEEMMPMKEEVVAEKLDLVEAGPPTKTWDELRKSEVVEAYRKKTLLNATFSATKIGKQVILSNIGFSGTEPAVKHLLGTYQKKFESATAGGSIDMEQFAQALDLSMNQIDAEAPDLIAFNKAHGPFADQRAFVAAYLKVHQEKDAKNAFLKKYPKVNESIIKVVAL